LPKAATKIAIAWTVMRPLRHLQRELPFIVEQKANSLINSSCYLVTLYSIYDHKHTIFASKPSNIGSFTLKSG
jgi:hypothetical protein